MTTATFSNVAAGFRHHPLSCFAAGFISVLLFQMAAWAVFYALGMTPNAPFGYAPTRPFGVPQIWSFAFWGGLWGLVFGYVERWFPQGPMYYVAAFLFGAIAPVLVLWFIALPLKGVPVAAGWNPMTMLFHVIVHGCFGLGIGVLLTYRDGRLQMLRA
jgi:hypothetical protein